jgi:hypothetical protein
MSSKGMGVKFLPVSSFSLALIFISDLSAGRTLVVKGDILYSPCQEKIVTGKYSVK